jgi:hypothetical protein
MTPIDKLLADIASKHLDIETLQTRKADSLDFHEVAVWTLRAALEAAFNAGAEQARQAASKTSQ